MLRKLDILRAVGALTVLGALTPMAVGQIAGVRDFQDPESDALCNVVNAANTQLVVLTDTGQLAVVSGEDTVLEDTLVDETGAVTFEGGPAGFLRFDTDGDGARRVFWETLTGRLITVDGISGVPTESNRTSDDLRNVSCDACEFLDNAPECPEPEPRETTITRQPVGGTTCADQQVTLLVEATGANIESYQWFKNNVAIPGAAGQILTIESVVVFDTAAYHVDVIDTDGSRVTSDVAIVVVEPECAPASPPGLGLCGPGAGMITLLTLAGLLGIARTARARTNLRS